ncbi:hypothetical protein WAA20_00130 [Butyrivibrio fibrisolvens]
MGRIKWNLDLLEEVKKQHDEAMTATEQVINNGKSDLSSLTEDVWEGEDGDMARDQLHDLLNKEMVETWKELDACNEAIQKAQKTAYESKNFCNRFPQIFRSGSMPSESDQGACSGDLLCDNDSCSSLKDSMSEAGQRALNVKSKVESAESVLAELETDVAKFDYSSYTEPIKTQTQNVADRTGVYNSSVSRYEQKTQEMDNTFSNELIAATPVAVPEPFDPSCLELGDDVHMKDGDIINFLEEYNAVELGGKLSDAQLENILERLFDKKDIDVSRLSEEDFGIAFINLPEEQKKAVLLEMGYSNDQIESILESCKGQKGPAAGSAFARTLVDRIAGKNKNRYHGGDDKTVLKKALGLSGLRRPGDGIAKTHAETYAGDEKLFGKASEETKKEHKEKQKEKQKKEANNDTSTITYSGEADSNGTYDEYMTEDEEVNAEIKRLLDKYEENGCFDDENLSWDQMDDVTKKALSRIAEVDIYKIEYSLSNLECAESLKRVDNILLYLCNDRVLPEGTVFNSNYLDEMYGYMSNDIVKQYLEELKALKQEDYSYTVGGVWPNVHIGPDGVVFELIDNISMDITEILCHKSDWRIKEEVIAANLDGYLELLCDDDNSNDESAIKGIDLWMKNFIIEKEEDGKRYVAYDEKLIKDVLAYKYDGLAHQLLSSLDKQIEMRRESGEPDPTVIAELTSSLATIENTYLKAEKYGAGVKLSIISDYSDEINEVVAYAVTKTSTKNFFMNGDEYDWDAIKEWCQLELPLAQEVEYDFLVDCLVKMSDTNMDNFLDNAQIIKSFGKAYEYDYSDQVMILMAKYEKKAKDLVVAIDSDENTRNYTRAICCSQAVATVKRSQCIGYSSLTFDEEEGSYIVNLDRYNGVYITQEDYIKVYPAYAAKNMSQKINDGILNLIEPSKMGCAASILDGLLQCATIGAMPFSYLGCAVAEYLASTIAGGIAAACGVAGSYLEDYRAFSSAEGGLDLQSMVLSYGVHGYLVEQSINGALEYNVVIDSFDESMIHAATIYYNECMAGQSNNSGAKPITTQQLKDSFLMQNETTINYSKFFENGGEDRIDDISYTIGLIAGYLNDGDYFYRSNDITSMQASEAAEVYIRMREYVEQYPQNYRGVENLEQLTDIELKKVYQILLIAGYMYEGEDSSDITPEQANEEGEDSNDITPEQVNEAEEVYARMKTYIEQHPEKYGDVKNLEQLSDAELQTLYQLEEGIIDEE